MTPDGALVRADADHEPDLFWAVRGGGGSVGVVTALEMTLYPVSAVYAGAPFFPIERASELLHTWRQWTDTLPDELTSLGRILRFPPTDEVPAALRGRAFALVEAAYLGGALARETPGAGAQPKIDAKYGVFAVGFTPTPDLVHATSTRVRALKDALAPWNAGYDYYNFVETPADADVVLPPTSHQRLRKIKATYDPDQTIISAHPVRPSARANHGEAKGRVDR